MKTWEEMTAKERAEQTIRDIKKRQELKKIGQREADSFIINQYAKAKKHRDKIRCKSYRGK